ncbi:hypothetical protein [Jeotgalibaca porci]|uniref:hypothetical protein n=1 Tax=Jeotgalibaca porci TaxID=1868793 RepID=UPI0035A02E8B
MARALDLSGEVYGKLTVIKRVENDKHGKARWLCRCECGNESTPNGADLRSGKSRSCGCSHVTHGLSHHRTHNIFTQMKERCYNPKHISYPWYGEKGVEIHQGWLDDFSSFYNWAISNGYSDALEIDRIDSAGDYTPNNCRWVTRTVQNVNQPNRVDNTSGVKGVKWNKSRKKWEANIDVNKKRHYLGLYDIFEEAVNARKEAEKRYSR